MFEIFMNGSSAIGETRLQTVPRKAQTVLEGLLLYGGLVK